MSDQSSRYEAELLAYFNEALPCALYDAHFHLTRRYAEKKGYTDPYRQYADFMERTLGRRIAGGMVMTQPSGRHTKEILDDENAYNIALAREHGLAAGHVVAPWNEKAEVAAVLDQNPEVRALKPYLTYSTAPDRLESNISDFTPEWVFELSAERGLPVILHLSHYGEMLGDENNLRELRYFSEKYPAARIVLAHCAMGHHVRKLRLALPRIADLKNLWFDCSGASETMSVYYCLTTFGPERMLWGGDHNFGEDLGRIASYGSGFLAVHPGYLNESALPRDYRYEPLSNTAECLVALLEAADLLSLTRTEREGIFYHNAKALFGR